MKKKTQPRNSEQNTKKKKCQFLWRNKKKKKKDVELFYLVHKTYILLYTVYIYKSINFIKTYINT